MPLSPQCYYTVTLIPLFCLFVLVLAVITLSSHKNSLGFCTEAVLLSFSVVFANFCCFDDEFHLTSLTLRESGEAGVSVIICLESTDAGKDAGKLRPRKVGECLDTLLIKLPDAVPQFTNTIDHFSNAVRQLLAGLGLLVCTDTSLSEKEIIALYGKRWDIEVFFKTCKSVLKLTSECRSMNYDAICAHTAIVFLRYMFLAVELRKEQDERTAGPLFCLICDEIADVTFGQSFEKLQQIWENLLRELKLPEEQITLLFQNFRDSLTSELALILGLLPNCRAAA